MQPPVTADNLRVYLPSRRSKSTFVIIGSGQIVMGVFTTFLFVRDGIYNSSGFNFMVPFVLGVSFFTIGFIFIRGALKLSVVLSSNSIRVHTLVRSTTLPFDEILGKRSRAGKYSTHTLLIPKGKHHRKIVIKPSFGFAFDDTYTRWLASVPDLDATEKEERRAAGNLHIWEE